MTLTTLTNCPDCGSEVEVSEDWARCPDCGAEIEHVAELLEDIAW